MTAVLTAQYSLHMFDRLGSTQIITRKLNCVMKCLEERKLEISMKFSNTINRKYDFKSETFSTNQVKLCRN